MRTFAEVLLICSIPELPIMSTTTTATETVPGSISVQAHEDKPISEQYNYAHLFPVFQKDEHYPPLTPFEHVDPGHRALKHENPRSFLANAKVTQLTPPIGEEVRGVNLATLDDTAKDQLALEVGMPYQGLTTYTNIVVLTLRVRLILGRTTGCCCIQGPARLHQ